MMRTRDKRRPYMGQVRLEELSGEAMEDEGLFGKEAGPTPEAVWELYERGRSFNEAIDLYETVNTNENFFIGKQWEGVEANGLPTPVFNILKRDVCFVVSSITTDNLTVQVTPLAASAGTAGLAEPARILSEEFERIFEHNGVIDLVREFARDAAVRGDGCIYTYWDSEARDGAVKSEVIPNTRVHFGDPNDRRVQNQPYIIVESREIVRNLRRRAREYGSEDWDDISADDDNTHESPERRTDDKATKLLMMWKDKNTGEVWGYECARPRRCFCPSTS